MSVNPVRKAVEYRTVRTTYYDFDKLCTSMLKDGWEPAGGVSWDKSGKELCQAFIRYETTIVA